ncbi:MAG TPA: class I SAM-dependent methyltransferase [Caulobacteraceae bacterium]|nr:class I SAM-dependent methyltransferase [Caulobacteraceae bacterium]
MSDVNVLSAHPNVARLAGAVLEAWPDHARFLEQSFAGRDGALMASSERAAATILRIIGGPAALPEFCADYRFLCDCLLEEELHFRRTGAYRLSRFDDAVAEVYSNRAFMRRYMNFLLLSHVVWDNHARALAHFETAYLPSLPHGARHLEIGPGHGLLLHLACAAPAVAGATAWDVSQTSIDFARQCLTAAGGADRAELVLQDLFDAPASDARFDSVVMAEVLEHLEDPLAALESVARHMAPGGRLWIHVPINSPAPDHLYLLRTPEEAVELVRAAGFEPLDTAFFPMTGATLERARKRALTISAVIDARLA